MNFLDPAATVLQAWARGKLSYGDPSMPCTDGPMENYVYAYHLFALSNPALTSALSKKSFSTVRRRSSPPSSRCREPGFHQPFRQKPHCYAQGVELSKPSLGWDELQTSLLTLQRTCPLGEPQRPLGLEGCEVCMALSTCHNWCPYHRYTTDCHDQPTHL